MHCMHYCRIGDVSSGSYFTNFSAFIMAAGDDYRLATFISASELTRSLTLWCLRRIVLFAVEPEHRTCAQVLDKL